MKNRLMDITERKFAEKALRESEEQHRSLMQSFCGLAFRGNMDFVPVFLHGAVEELTGYREEELIAGKPSWDKVVHPSDFSSFLSPEAIHLQTVPDYSIERSYRIVRKDGATRWVHESIQNVCHNSEKPNFVQGTIYDITERKHMEEELRRKERPVDSVLKLYALSDATLEEIAGFVIETCVMVSGSAIGFFGIINENETKMITHLFSHEARESCGIDDRPVEFAIEDAGMWADAIRECRPIIVNDYLNNHNRKTLPDGHVPIRRLLTVPIVEEGRVVALVAVGNKDQEYNQSDISHLQVFGQTAYRILQRQEAKAERVRLEAQLMQVHKMEAIGTLAGGIAHDFNNILAVAMGCTELSLEDIPSDTPIHARLTEALNAINRAKDLVNQILTFSRQDANARKPMAIEAGIKEALKMLRSSLPTTIEIQQNIHKDLGLIVADPTQIHQIIMNLATNASQAMRETGGLLKVDLQAVELSDQTALRSPDLKPGHYIKLSVSDTGHGIEPEAIKLIFDPYYTKGKGDGTGLGLSVVHGIVKNHGGAIVASSEPGTGTTFEVFFPRIDAEAKQIETRQVEDIPTGTERILLVDDQMEVSEVYDAMLKGLGYSLSVRTSSVEALEAFKAQPDEYDLIITDETMPVMTGHVLAKEILSIRPDIPVILCTGYSDLIDAIKAEHLGISAFVMKPLARGEIARVIRQVLDK